MQRSRAAIMTLTIAAAVSLTLGTSGIRAEGYFRQEIKERALANIGQPHDCRLQFHG